MITNKIFKNVFLHAILVSLIFHLFVLFSSGCYYESGSDTYFKNVCSGAFLSEPQPVPFSFGGQVVFSRAYSFLYHEFPGVLWYDVFSLTFSVLAGALLIVLIFNVLKLGPNKPKSSAKCFVISCLIALPAYYEGAMMIELTRYASIIAMCCMMLLLTVEEGVSLICIPLLLLSMFFRPEVFPFAILLLIPWMYLVKPPLARLKRTFLPALFVYVFLIILCNLPYNEEESSYIHFRPNQFALIDYRPSPVSTNTISFKDSVALDAARHAFWNDGEVLNESFYSRFIPKMDKTPQSAINYIKYTNYSLQNFLYKARKTDQRYWILVVIPLIFIISSLIFRRALLAFSVIAACYYILFLGLITLFFKMENRVLYPVLMACILTIMSAAARNSFLNGTGIILGLIIFLIFDRYSALEASNICNTAEHAVQFNRNLKVLPEASGKTFLYDEKIFTETGLKLFEDPGISGVHVFSIDNGILFMNAQYQKDCRQLFGTVNTAAIVSIISSKNSNFLWVGTIPRTRMLVNYFNTEYHFNLQYRILSKLPEPGNENDSPVLMQFLMTEPRQ